MKNEEIFIVNYRRFCSRYFFFGERTRLGNILFPTQNTQNSLHIIIITITFEEPAMFAYPLTHSVLIYLYSKHK